MTLNNWDKIVVDKFYGLFNRGDVSSIPDGYSAICENMDFNYKSIFTRPGVRSHLSTSVGTPTTFNRIRRISFQSDGQVRYLIMHKSSTTLGSVKLYDSVENVDVATITCESGQEANMDFSCIMLFDRCYINVYLNTGQCVKTVTAQQKLYVYEYGAVSTITLASGGAGYAANDILQIIDPNQTTGKNATIQVNTVAAGVISTFTLKTSGTKYSATGVASSAPLTGTGSGATFNITARTTSFRQAAGSPPSGFTLGAAVSATAGTVETGRHLFGVAYETESGFITAIGPTAWTLLNVTTASKKVDISSIPVGPSGTVARHIIASKVIFQYNSKNFNQLEHEMFFIPNGRIPDNTRTTYTVDFLDSQLLSSADYLIDQLSAIPAGTVFTDYNGRLITGGGYNTETIANSGGKVKLLDETYVLRGSLAGAPESFDSTVGFANIAPDDAGGGLTSAKEDRGLLYLFKFNRTYVTQDIAPNVIDWRSDLIDGGIGALGPEAVSQILDSKGLVLGGLLVAHKSGLRALSSQYNETPLSWNFDTAWDNGPGLNNTIQVLIDPTRQKIYCGYNAITSPKVSNNGLLMLDYQEGLSPDKIKASWWIHPNLSNGFYFFTSGTEYYLGFNAGLSGGAAKTLYFKDTTVVKDADLSADDVLTIQCYWTPNSILFSDDEAYCQMNALRILAKGSGSLALDIYDRNISLLVSPVSLTLTSGFSTLMRQTNAQNEGFIPRLSNSGSGSWFELSKVFFLGNQMFETRPQ